VRTVYNIIVLILLSNPLRAEWLYWLKIVAADVNELEDQ